MAHKIFYNSHAPRNVYDIIREDMPESLELVTLETDSDDERKAKIADCEAVIVAAKPLTAEVLAAAPGIKLLHHQGVGYYDTMPVPQLKERGIRLALTPAGTSTGVAEHAILLMLAVGKRLPFADSELRQGRWHINALRPHSIEIDGRTIGYVGMGRIARAVAVRLKAFNTRGLYFDPGVNLEAGEEIEFGVRKADLDSLLAESDIVTLHVPSNAETRHLIDAAALARMKRTAILINTARGSIVDESALVVALRDGSIAGAGLDVFADEPVSPDNPLCAMANVVLTPHISAGTRDALKTKMRVLFANVVAFFDGRPMENEVVL